MRATRGARAPLRQSGHTGQSGRARRPERGCVTSPTVSTVGGTGDRLGRPTTRPHADAPATRLYRRLGTEQGRGGRPIDGLAVGGAPGSRTTMGPRTGRGAARAVVAPAGARRRGCADGAVRVHVRVGCWRPSEVARVPPERFLGPRGRAEERVALASLGRREWRGGHRWAVMVR